MLPSPHTRRPSECAALLLQYLVLRGVMDGDWLAEANAAVEGWEANGVITSDNGRNYSMPPSSMMALPPPHSLPFRRMLAHPAIAQRLNWILGGGFRCNRPGNLIEWRGDWAAEGISGGHRLHGGAHPLLPEFNYHAYAWRNGRSHAGSCNVAWQLHPVGPDDGGAVLVPGSVRRPSPIRPG